MPEQIGVLCEKLASSPEQIKQAIGMIATAGAQIQAERANAPANNIQQTNQGVKQ